MRRILVRLGVELASQTLGELAVCAERLRPLARLGQAAFYPSAYRIAYDAAAREYRIALTQLARRQ